MQQTFRVDFTCVDASSNEAFELSCSAAHCARFVWVLWVRIDFWWQCNAATVSMYFVTSKYSRQWNAAATSILKQHSKCSLQVYEWICHHLRFTREIIVFNDVYPLFLNGSKEATWTWTAAWRARAFLASFFPLGVSCCTTDRWKRSMIRWWADGRLNWKYSFLCLAAYSICQRESAAQVVRLTALHAALWSPTHRCLFSSDRIISTVYYSSSFNVKRKPRTNSSALNNLTSKYLTLFFLF